MTLRLLLLAGMFSAVSLAQSNPAQNPQDFVRNAVLNELHESEQQTSFFRYMLRKQTSSGTAVRDMCETRKGVVARSLTWNDRPLSPEERSKDDKKLLEWASSADEQEKHLRDQQAEQRRILAVLRALPRGATYTFNGTEKIHGREAVRLHFVPNPDFEPTTRETYIFRAAVGDVWIDSGEHRIVRLQATLMRGINFGWGLLGQIHMGGTILLEQTMVGSHAWRMTKLDLDAKGTALLFKEININQHQSAFDYRPVPPNLSVADAVALLRESKATADPAKP